MYGTINHENIYFFPVNQNPRKAPFEHVAEHIYETCDDATVSMSNGQWMISFDREAESLTKALSSAVGDVETRGYRVISLLLFDMLTAAAAAEDEEEERQEMAEYLR